MKIKPNFILSMIRPWAIVIKTSEISDFTNLTKISEVCEVSEVSDSSDFLLDLYANNFSSLLFHFSQSGISFVWRAMNF